MGKRSGKAAGDGRLAPWLTFAFAAVLCLLAASGRIGWWVPAWYAAQSAIAFAVYAMDKAAAGRGRRRVPERRLHLLAALGGWPGALAGQRLLRHKTRKQPFQRWFAAAVVLNCAVLGGQIWFWTLR